MASQDKRKGASHLEQLVMRHPQISDDDPLTLELLAKHSKVQLADMIEIYNKKANKPYELAPTGLDILCSAIHKMEEEKLSIVEAPKPVIHSTLPLPSRPPPLVRQKGYFQPAPIPTKPVAATPAATPAPPLPPRPRPVKAPEQKKDNRVFDEEALIKVYEYVNRCERWMRKEIKTQPTPKSLSNKYKDYIH